MQPDPTIYGIYSREILDSRGNPTIETTVILKSGYRGTASIPSGASVGTHEAIELRDQDPNRYHGMGVLKAVENVHTVISPALVNETVLDQAALDKKMIALDGTEHKEKLGANAILSVSIAAAKAAAAYSQMPLYRYLNKLFSVAYPTDVQKIPTPIFNMINGGKHGAGNLNFQEFQIVPAMAKSFNEGLLLGTTLYREIKEILISRGAVHSVGDEGGFAPNLFTNLDALEIMMEAVRVSRFQFGIDVFFGLDVAAHSFKTDQGYQIKDRITPFSTHDFIGYLKDLHKKYHLLLLEDALDEDDWEGWKELVKEVGKDILIIGDDLLVTNYTRLERAIQEKACSAILLKPNQIGTLSEFFGVVMLAKQHDIKCIVSHRSGETNDDAIADIAVSVQSEYIKFGAPVRGERVAKYNRLLQIEQELGKKEGHG